MKLTIFFTFIILPWFCLAELTIGTIRFEGNESISDQKIYQTIYAKNGAVYNQEMINADALRISDLYKFSGKLNVKVLQPQIITLDPQNIDIVFLIQEDAEILIEKLILQGNRYISTEKIASKVNLQNIALTDLDSKLQSLAEYYAENSFLFAEINVDSLVHNTKDFVAYISIDEGSFCEFEEYRFSGNKVTTEQTILRISRLAGANRITPHILQKAADNVQHKEYIKSCQIIPLNSRQVLFQIEEDRMSLISGVLGYDNSKRKRNRFAGYAKVQFLNLYGTDRSLKLHWQRLSAKRSMVELSYHETGWQRYPFSADFVLKREEVDSTYISTEFDSDIYFHDISQKYGLYFGWEEIFPGSRRPKQVENTSFQKIGAFWEFSSLDYFRNPTRGYEYLIKYYYIFHKISRDNISKQAVELRFDTYRRLLGKLIFASKVNARIIENKKLQQFELFSLCGYSSLRGFDEDQFTGYQTIWTNLEFRFITSRNTYIFLFTDHGYIKNEEFTFKDLFGFGLGINLQTRLGMLGITYGFSYQNGELRNPLDGIIHFGIESKL